MSIEPANEARRAQAPAFRDPRTDPEAARDLERVCRKYGLKLVVLFGSQATGRTHALSDIDVAYLPGIGKEPDALDLGCEFMKLWNSDHVDSIDMRKAPPLLAWNIARRGVVLLGDERGDWWPWQAHAIKNWDDCRTADRWRAARLERSFRARGLL